MMMKNRKFENVWNYKDADNLNTDQMFAGNLTYNILSSDGEAIMPHLFEGFDPNFHAKVRKDDIIIAGDNFGCGSSLRTPGSRTCSCWRKGCNSKICKQDILSLLGETRVCP